MSWRLIDFHQYEVEENFDELDHARWWFAGGDDWREPSLLHSFLLHGLTKWAEDWREHQRSVQAPAGGV